MGSGWRGVWTPRRAWMWLVAATIAAYLPLVAVPVRGWLDFSAFYAAGSLVFTSGVTDLGAIIRFQAESGLPITPFPYPASVALAYAPLALLPYDLAAALHVAIMFVVLVLAARLGADLLGIPGRWAVLGVLAWGPAAAGVVSGQNSSLALLLVVVSAASLARGRDGIAGAAAGLLAYKPQLAAPQAGLLVLCGRRGALVPWLLAIGAHYWAGVLATGGELGWPVDWLSAVRDYSPADFQANGWQASSLPSIGTRLELVLGIPGAALAGWVIGGIIMLACLPPMRRMPPLDAVALACAAGLVISPHAWVYDATLLLPAIGVFAVRATARGWPWQDRWLLAAGYAVAITWPLGGFLGATAVILLVVAAPIVLVRQRQLDRGQAWSRRLS